MSRHLRIFFPLFAAMIILLGLSAALAQDRVGLTMIVSRDSLTIYIPGSGSVSLQELRLEVSVEGRRISRSLSDYTAFSALYFEQVPIPICFRLQRSGGDRTAPQACNNIRILTETLLDADVFWYDNVLGRSHTVLLMRGSTQLDLCPAGETECQLTYQPPSPTPTPSPTQTPVPTLTPIPLGFSGNPVTSNRQWTPISRTFNGVEMVMVPVGCFMMGSTDEQIDYAAEFLAEGLTRDVLANEQPVHEQCFNQQFWIDRYEVTNAQYGSSGYFSGANRPRMAVTWFEARGFCEGRSARLPTEAEWEYAARGPDNLMYPWGNEFVADNVVYWRNSGDQTADVGSRPGGVSWVGAYDMSGNIGEWVSTAYDNYDMTGEFPYPYDPNDGRDDLGRTDVLRVLRGGSFLDRGEMRAANRSPSYPEQEDDGSGSGFGFRCALSQ